MAEVKNARVAGSVYYTHEKAQSCANELSIKDGKPYSVERKE